MSPIYRIQSKQDKKRGAYRSHIYGDRCPDAVNRLHKEHMGRDDGHPAPRDDINRPIGENEYCKFNSAAALLRWFRGFIPDLLRAGYEIVALNDVVVTAVGKYQVVFKWKGKEGTK